MRYTIVATIRDPQSDYNRKDIAIIDGHYAHEAKSAYKVRMAPAVVKTFLEVYQSTEAEIYLWDRLHGVDVQL